MFGRVHATVKASQTVPAPKRAAERTSRKRPRMRLPRVQVATTRAAPRTARVDPGRGGRPAPSAASAAPDAPDGKGFREGLDFERALIISPPGCDS